MELASLNRLAVLSRQDSRKTSNCRYGYSAMKLIHFLRSKSREGSNVFKKIPQYNYDFSNHIREKLKISSDFPQVKTNLVIPTSSSMKNFLPGIKETKLAANSQTKSSKIIRIPAKEEITPNRVRVDKTSAYFSNVIKPTKTFETSQLSNVKMTETKKKSFLNLNIKSLSPISSRKVDDILEEFTPIMKRFKNYEKRIKKKLETSYDRLSQSNISSSRNKVRETPIVKKRKPDAIITEPSDSEEIIGWDKDTDSSYSETPTLTSRFSHNV
ncbi:unnamed protein product [Blepharisma stoltei]|uniref:Uncharacterized protein n=1 Tax=Blepharisma stoltei TaxID=1481888 RepID=A0AAU9ITI2_9CILI|nr:unnamed protein product [Blepharisma stoltei]